MKKTAFLIAISSFVLAGCVTYTYGGKQYESQEQVVAAQKEDTQRLLSDITPLAKPVTNKTLRFIYPGYHAFMTAQEKMDQIAGVTRNAVQRGDAEIKAKTMVGNYEFTAAMIKKRNLYQQVTFVESSTFTVSEPVVSDMEEAMYITCGYSDDGKQAACGTFYVSKKYGKQVFASDRSSPDYREVNKAYLQAVEAFAIRE